MYDSIYLIAFMIIVLALLSLPGCASKQKVIRTTNCSAKFEYNCVCDCDKKDFTDVLIESVDNVTGVVK